MMSYGKMKCTDSELTMSIVGASELPKSMYNDSSWAYLQKCNNGRLSQHDNTCHVIIGFGLNCSIGCKLWDGEVRFLQVLD